MKAKGFSIVALLTFLPFAALAQNGTVGNPNNPVGLRNAILEAYDRGVTNITITPGTYLLPHRNDQATLTFENLSNFTINAYHVDLVMEATNQDSVRFIGCRNVTMRGATIHYSVPHTGQAKILSLGQDATGVYYNVKLDEGYPQNADFQSSAIMDGDSVHIKPGTQDIGATKIVTLATPGEERIYWYGVPSGNPWEVVPGDYVVCRGPGSVMFHPIQCDNCTFQDLTFYWGGAFCFLDSDGGRNNHYLHDTLTYGPKPPHATNDPLLSETADAFHCADAVVGPDIENCTFQGMLDDGIAIHGSYYLVEKSIGNKLIIGSRSGFAGFLPGEPIVLQNDNSGIFFETKVSDVVPINFTASQQSAYHAFQGVPLTFFELTLDVPPNMPFDSLVYNPSQCGSGFRLLGNTIRNHRARGMLIKANNGLIQSNLIDGSTLNGIVISPEGEYWGEAGYSVNIDVINNTIEHTSFAMTGPWNEQAGALAITGEGSIGHRNIKVIGNRFVGIDVANIQVQFAEGTVIGGNLFLQSHLQPSPCGLVGSNFGIDANSLIWIGDARKVNIFANYALSPGTMDLVSVGANATGVTGQDTGVIVLP